MSLTTCAELLIRPARMEYRIDELDGPYFHVEGKACSRIDRTVTNKRGLKIELSFFEPCILNGPNPCVVYCHGKGGSRVSGRNASIYLLQAGVSVCLFDFAGCGKSEGDYITMGHHEIDDIEAVVEFVKSTNKVSAIGLWGRSMGAAAALLYAAKYPKNAQCLILDSLYHNLTKMIVEWLNATRGIPKCALWTFLRVVNWKVRRLTGADLYKINPIEAAPKVTIPAIFSVGKEDSITLPHYIEQVFTQYAGPKELLQFPGEHDTARPESFFKHVCDFVKISLRPPLPQLEVVPELVQEVPVQPQIPPIRSNSTNVEHLQRSQTPLNEELEAANPVSPPISSPRHSEEQVSVLPPLPPPQEPQIEEPFPNVLLKNNDEEEQVLVIHEEANNQEKESPRTSQEFEVTQPLDSAKHSVVKRDRIWSDAATGTSSITSPAELMQQLASITKMPLPSPVALTTKQTPLSLLVNQPPEVYKPPHRIFD